MHEEVSDDDSPYVETASSSSESDDNEVVAPQPQGTWSVIAGRGTAKPRLDADSLRAAIMPQSPPKRRKFLFYLRASPSGTGLGNSALCKVTLPPSWADATVGHLLDLVARQRQLPAWDVHLSGPRGVLPNEFAETNLPGKGS